ncbi:MAG: SGNH/GDSL hydrolase family protein [Bacteroidia bacterium]
MGGFKETKMNWINLKILVSITLFFSFIGVSKAECKKDIDLSKVRIGIVGDSFFTTSMGEPGSFASSLADAFNTKEVENSAIGGSKVLGFGSNTIIKQKLMKAPDILIFGGGGNDFVECGSDKNCLSKKLNSIVSPNLEYGGFIKLLAKHSNKNTYSIILYPTVVGDSAPPNYQYLIQSGLGIKYAKRMQDFAASIPNLIWIDAGYILDKSNREHWRTDGYHPSSKAYELLSKKVLKNFCAAE